MEIGLRGFLVTGEDQYLEPCFGGQKDFEKLVAKGAELTSDNPTQVSRWGEIKTSKVFDGTAIPGHSWL